MLQWSLYLRDAIIQTNIFALRFLKQNKARKYSNVCLYILTGTQVYNKH